MKTRLEFVGGKSEKFWQGEVKGTKLVVSWGRLGTDGQTKTKSMGSSKAAAAELEKLVSQKLAKGYEVLSGGASKKKAATKKTATKKTATKKTAAVPLGAARPLADSPAPKHVRVDIGSADAEAIKMWRPSAPQPVFSTMALAHGKRAAAAKTVKPGFSWNAQMDLLWALGYPELVLIADGVPGDDSKKGLLKYWNGSKGPQPWWIDASQDSYPRVISRRGAFALLHEARTAEPVFELDESEFSRVTEPRELNPEEVMEILVSLEAQSWIEPTARVLEALVGPSLVLDVLCSMAEEAGPNVDPEFAQDWRFNAKSALEVLLRRVPQAERKRAIKRLSRLEPEVGGSIAEDLEGEVRKDLAEYPEFALSCSEWLDGCEQLVLDCYRASYPSPGDYPDVPSPRLVYAGGAKVAALEAANHGRYDRTYTSIAYAADYTTMRDPALLPAALSTLRGKSFEIRLSCWLRAHAMELRPGLEALAKKPGFAASARRALKVLA